MTRWGAGFSVMAEITKSLINGVVEKYLAPLRSQGHLTFTKQLGRVGKISATLDKLTLEDIEDPAPVGGGVETDLQSEVSLDYRLLWLIHGTPTLVATIENVLVDLPTTPAGLPRGVVLAVTRGFSIRVGFTNARCIAGWLLNTLIAPLLSLGIWLAFTILRRVELPIWPLVDVFNAVGLLFAPGSPLLTAQDQTGDNSLLLASDFSLTGPQGDPRHVASFVPANTNAAAVVHERTVAAAVELAIAKGWVPSRFKVSGWKIYINSIRVAFKQDTIEASGELKAKRGKCWCRVKAKIMFRAAVRPRIVDEATLNPKVFFTYDADVKTEISSSGMLVVLGVIMFAPVFMALTLATSFLINIVLRQFLPFTTQAKIDGLKMTVQAASLGFYGFIPLSMKFPLELKGHGTYDLSRFLQFELPDLWGVQPTMSVQYTPESISLDEGELRLGAKLS
jgi:hypothetical protein